MANITIDKEIIAYTGKRYMLTKKYLGGGAFGAVYLALDEDGKKYALKTIIDTNNNMDFFINEMNILYNYSNYPNCNKYLVCIYDHLLIGNVLQIVMEYIEGETLLNVNLTEDILKQCVEGLESFSSKNIVHRDIKPDNILIDKNDNIKYVDFGTGCSITELNGNPHIINICKGTPGTESYLDPMFFSEKIQIACQYSDIYSLGITFCVMMGVTIPKYRFQDKNTFNDKYENLKTQIDSTNYDKKIKQIVKAMVNPNLPRPTPRDILNFLNNKTSYLNLGYNSLVCGDLDKIPQSVKEEFTIDDQELLQNLIRDAKDIKNDDIELEAEPSSDKTYLKLALENMPIPYEKKQVLDKKIDGLQLD